MFNHAPPSYRCPFCAIAAGIQPDGVETQQAEIVLRDENVIAFIAAHWWPRNPAHVLVVPIQHYENLYDLPDEISASVAAASRRIAIGLKHSYQCAVRSDDATTHHGPTQIRFITGIAI